MKVKYNFLKYLLLFATMQFVPIKDICAQDEGDSTKAKMVLSFSEEDSVKTAKVLITSSDGKKLKDIDVHFYIKKSFGLLPIAGDNTTTDEQGETSVDFPKDMPGDSIGNLIVIAKVEDNDDIGNLETTESIKWGIPVVPQNTFNQRALWATGRNAPLPLVIIVTSMVVGVWAVIIYIVFQLIQIKKSGLEQHA